MKVIVKHTAGLGLPPVEGHRAGQELVVGENEVDDDYFEAVMGNPTVEAWGKAGMLQLGDEPEKPKRRKKPLIDVGGDEAKDEPQLSGDESGASEK
jgi:hypothetical protein